MFNTDDGVFFEDVIVPEEVFSIIRNNPENASYRLYVGDNLEGMPHYLEKKMIFTSGIIIKIRSFITGHILFL